MCVDAADQHHAGHEQSSWVHVGRYPIFPTSILFILLQGEEWRQTALAPAVELFETSFLHGLEAHARDELALKARSAAAKPSFAW